MKRGTPIICQALKCMLNRTNAAINTNMHPPVPYYCRRAGSSLPRAPNALGPVQPTAIVDSQEVKFTDGPFYEKHFDSREYLKAFAVDPSTRHGFLPFVLRHLHNTFSTGDLKGKKLIGLGSGPSIYIIISARKCFEEIVLSDFTTGNRREIEKWLKNDEGSFDWHPIIKFVCELEGKSRSPEEVEQKLRKIVQFLKCDVTLENPFQPEMMEPVDCITSSLCLEAACKDLETYRRAVGSIAALLKPGGTLMLTGILNQSYYFVGKQRFDCLVLTQSMVEETVKGQGFSIKLVDIQPATEEEKAGCDGDPFFYLVAQKTE
ncbi:hypothetical protein COCON_G00188210 [Conger conger]|uniref:Nicotinamide N-methyltransferase-like n=1 Tax=Conger conger TaxID=82655 RepID=A0A9Q1HRP3_CONCO|nr:indolethylamine N-methyltransferase-like [Conger conger]KAJ8256669.1 hypothetical protein COCON_G00188210 [Conger conger]